MSLQINDVFTLFIIILALVIFLYCVGNPNLVFAQNSYTPNISNDSRNIIIKYCLQFADSVSKGMDVVQDLIGAGVVPSSYYDKTCQDEINR